MTVSAEPEPEVNLEDREALALEVARVEERIEEATQQLNDRVVQIEKVAQQLKNAESEKARLREMLREEMQDVRRPSSHSRVPRPIPILNLRDDARRPSW